MKRNKKHITAENRKNIIARKFAFEERINAVLKNANQKQNKFKQKIEALCLQKELNSYELQAIHIEIRNGFTLFKTKKRNREALKRLITTLDEKNCKRLLENKNFLIGLVNIAGNEDKFIRSIYDWKRNSHSPAKQFSSLLRHLFCVYAVPLFLDTAWVVKNNQKEQQWLRLIGIGISVRKLNNLPVLMTKKMAHQFGNVPSNLTVSEALRWTQVVGKGGKKNLAKIISQSPISRNNFTNEPFWESVIDLMVRTEAFDYTKINEIMDYLSDSINENENYTLKGRTINTIVRNSDRWHVGINTLKNNVEYISWHKSGINEYEKLEGPEAFQTQFTIVELLSTIELTKEGRKMNHCVASYASPCVQKRCAIFSIRKKMPFEQESTSIATIEVAIQTRRIVQAKARFNKVICKKATQLLKSWTQQQNINIPEWVLKTN